MGKAKELAELANNLTVHSGAVTVSGFNYDNIVDSAPGALNTLNELAAALGDDANFSTTVTNSIATKLPLAGGTLTGDIAHAGNLTLDVSGILNLDADTQIILKDGGANYGTFYAQDGDFYIQSLTQDKDIVFYGNDNGTGVEAMRIDMSKDGDVGIGISTPSAKLDVVTNDDVYAAEFTQQNTTNGDGMLIQVGSTAAVDYALTVRSDAGNTSVLAAKADGKVGIGVFGPFADLTVGSSTTFNNGDNYISAVFQPAISGGESAGMLFGHYPATGYAKQGIFWERYVGSSGSGGQGKLHFVNRAATDTSVPTLADTRMTIDHLGNVGIGTTSPGARRLRIVGSTSSYPLALDSTDTDYQLEFQRNGTSEWWIAASASSFKIHENGVGDKLTILSGGSVGIGTTNPPAALSIYGNEATGMGISIHDDGWGGANGLYMMTVQNSNGAFVVRKNTANALDFSTSQNQLEVGTDGVRAIGYGNSATGDNVSVEYTGTAGGHQSGYLFRDKRDVVNAAVKNYLLDDGVGTAAAELQLYTSHGGTLTKQMNIDRYGYIDTTNPRFTVGAAPNARTGKTGIRAGRTVYNWFNYGRNDGNDYLHIKTNLTNIVGSNPQATMSSFHIRGYTYSTETIDSILGFHNWNGIYYSTAYRNNGSRTVVSASYAPYRSSDNKVVIVLNIGNNYPGISIDYMQNFEYTWYDVEVSAYSKSASTSGVY